MRKFLLAMVAMVLVLDLAAASSADAQILRARSEVATNSLDPSTEELVAAGVGALAGMGAAFLLLEGEFVPALELLGYTERTVVPVIGAVIGSVMSRFAYMDWKDRMGH